MNIRTGDSVVVITGKDKGKTGSVIRVLKRTNRIVVGDINMRTRHMKATPQQPGQKIVYEASIHVSNVMVIDPKTKKRSRIGTSIDSKGKKIRVAKKSSEPLTGKKVTAKKDTKEPNDSKEAKETKKKDVKKETVDTVAPKKSPFWKKVMNKEGSNDGDELKEDSHMKQDHSVPEQSGSQSTRSHQRGK